MPFTIGCFDNEIKWLKNKLGNSCAYFDYNGITPLKDVVNEHFGDKRTAKKHGVYLVRVKEKQEIIYIGKAGQIKQNGDFKRQDIPNRLKNTRRSKTANETFSEYSRDYGPLRIEYLLLTNKKLCPSFVEAFLLQAYLKKYGHLPKENQKF